MSYDFQVTIEAESEDVVESTTENEDQDKS